MDLDDLPKKTPDIVIGENLELMSVAELEHRVTASGVGDRPDKGGDCRETSLQERGGRIFPVLRRLFQTYLMLPRRYVNHSVTDSV